MPNPTYLHGSQTVVPRPGQSLCLIKSQSSGLQTHFNPLNSFMFVKISSVFSAITRVMFAVELFHHEWFVRFCIDWLKSILTQIFVSLFFGKWGQGDLLIAFRNNESHRSDLFHFQHSLRMWNWLFGIFQSNLFASSMSNVRSNPNTIYQTSVEVSTLTGIRVAKVLWEIILRYCFANLFLSTIPFLLSRWENWLWFSSFLQTVSEQVEVYVSTAWKFRWYY